jgi:hypothetical protein
MVQTGANTKDDYGTDDIFGEEEAEDKSIMKSLEYAENKMHVKLTTPEQMAKTNPNAPIKYDVEDIDLKINSSHLAAVTKKSSEDLGDCDIKDDECI